MKLVSVIRINSTKEDFFYLAQRLDEELVVRDGSDHSFYDQFNKTDAIKHAVVAYENDLAVGCGAIKEYEPGTMEVKRMYVLPASRGRGIAALILAELEKWSKELAFKRCILETGKKQPGAIALYKKNGYKLI